MARRRKNPAGGLALIFVGVIVALVAAIPVQAWIVAGVVAAVSLVVWVVRKSKLESADLALHQEASPQVHVTLQVGERASLISTRLKGDPVPSRWIPKGEPIRVANKVIQGGMLYYGSDLFARSGDVEPALIEPRARVSQTVAHYSQRQTDYWPSYSTISPDARATYLSWLASSRDDPSADIGYVFLYYYGLERRALIDAQVDPEAQAELPLIEAEVKRLLRIYGGNRSFSGYAGSFLEFLACQRSDPDASEPPVLEPRRGDLPLPMKLALGRIAASGTALPVKWALAWIKCDYRIGRPRVMDRCPAQFDALFAHRYSAVFGDGMKLSRNRTMLQVAYRPASAGFAGHVIAPVAVSLPDVTAVVAPIKKLGALVDECAQALAPYSRFLGKDPSGAGTLDGNLLLPQFLWPESARAALESLDAKIGDGLRVMTLGEVSTALGGDEKLSRSKVRALAHALQEMRIGIEPDILAGARTPKAEDTVILFRSDPEDASLRESSLYRAASVSLDLACSVALADGKAHPRELQFLMRQIDGWEHLSAAQRKRLRARLRMAIDAPPSLASLRTKLDPVPADGKRAIAHLMATLAQADGVVAPAEVRLLEKVYKALGLDAQAVYSDLHVRSITSAPVAKESAAATSKVSPPVTAEEPVREGISLDADRIAELQRETAEVSALLSKVFADEVSAAPEQSEERDEASSIIDPGLLGLDPEHSVFLRLLMTRDSWSRQELADAAADMELMLDGAIERINDAAFENFDAPLLEGEDPIEVSREVMEEVTA